MSLSHRPYLAGMLQSSAGADLLEQISVYLNASQGRIDALEAEVAKSRKHMSSVQTSLTTKISASDKAIRKAISAAQTSLTASISSGDKAVRKDMQSKISALATKFKSLSEYAASFGGGRQKCPTFLVQNENSQLLV